MSNSAPKIIALAGPNGAGKTTFAARLLPGRYGQIRFLNADLMAQELSPPDPESVALEAGRTMLDEMREMVDGRVTFAFETTLASRSLASHVRRARLSGYEFHLYFISVGSVELAVARVEERVRVGGHRIPEAVIRRRYVRGIRNFFRLYQPLAARWYVLDNSDYRHPLKIAAGSGDGARHVFQETAWRRFYEAQYES